MALLLGIDLGTSYFKVGVFDDRGALRGLGRIAVDAQRPAADRLELPVEQFWAKLRAALQTALQQAGASPRDLAGISYSSQANTFVLLDAADRPLTPLILWPDRRADPLSREVVAFGETPEHAAKTALLAVVPEQAPAKWRWFAQTEPDRWRSARRALTISDYLGFALTGEAIGDASTAVLTGLYDLTARAWWPDALARFGLEARQLAEPLMPGTVRGRTRVHADALLGLPAGISFAVGALDHHAAALGAGIESVADASLSIGTVLAILALVDDVKPSAGTIHGPHGDGRRFYRLAYDPNGAGQLEAYQRQFAAGLDIPSLLQFAETRAAPHGGPVRDILERVAARHAELLRDVVAGGARVRRIAATGGGARSRFWLQLIADAVRRPVVTPECAEPGCLGAAVFASVAAGVHRDVQAACHAMVRAADEIAPRN